MCVVTDVFYRSLFGCYLFLLFTKKFDLKDFLRWVDDLVLVQLVLLALVADFGHVDGVAVRGDGKVVRA